jgi:hypothetical protein
VSTDTKAKRPSPRIRWPQAQDAFFVTLRSYARLNELSVVSAINYDPDAPTRNYTLGPNSISTDFLCDCERITAKTLADDLPSQKCWFALLNGEPVDSELARDVVLACGIAYAMAGLNSYFAPTLRHHSTESSESRAA